MTDTAFAKTCYYTQDGLGSVRTLSDASGAVVNSYDYTAYGEKVAQGTVEAVQNRYQYTGREMNPVSNLMFYRNRMYSASQGMFFSRDPLLYLGSPAGGLYAYCGNNPIMYVDPTGEGFVDLILTGEWSPAPNVAEAALHAYNESIRTNAPAVASNTASLVGGVAQTVGGVTLATVTAPTGVGTVAGGVVAAQGFASVITSAKNLYDLSRGNTPSLNT